MCCGPAVIDQVPLLLSLSPPCRKRDLPGAVRPEEPAALVPGELLPLHRIPDHAAVQQGGGVDRLQPAHLRLLQTGECA